MKQYGWLVLVSVLCGASSGYGMFEPEIVDEDWGDFYKVISGSLETGEDVKAQGQPLYPLSPLNSVDLDLGGNSITETYLSLHDLIPRIDEAQVRHLGFAFCGSWWDRMQKKKAGQQVSVWGGILDVTAEMLLSDPLFRNVWHESWDGRLLPYEDLERQAKELLAPPVRLAAIQKWRRNSWTFLLWHAQISPEFFERETQCLLRPATDNDDTDYIFRSLDDSTYVLQKVNYGGMGSVPALKDTTFTSYTDKIFHNLYALQEIASKFAQNCARYKQVRLTGNEGQEPTVLAGEGVDRALPLTEASWDAFKQDLRKKEGRCNIRVSSQEANVMLLAYQEEMQRKGEGNINWAPIIERVYEKGVWTGTFYGNYTNWKRNNNKIFVALEKFLAEYNQLRHQPLALQAERSEVQ